MFGQYSLIWPTIWEIGHALSPEGVKPVVLATLDANYRCYARVLGVTSFAEREVLSKNGDNTRFRCCLLPTETEALGAGEFTAVFELRNPTLDPPLVREVHRKIRLWPQGRPTP